MTPTLWTLLAVSLVVLIGIAIAIRKTLDKARRSRYDRTVAQPCAANGHIYKPHDTGWRCATCGNYVSRREGEQFGPAEDGHIERRREGR